MDYEIFFACDENYLQHLCVSITSILLNSNGNFNFYIIDDNIQSKEKILNLKKIKPFNVEFIKPDSDLMSSCPNLNNYCGWSKQIFLFRYFIPKLKPNLEKIIYLDCDLVINGNLDKLWNIDMGDNYCAVVEDYNSRYSSRCAKRLGLNKYFNSGVMLINNKKWVEENICETLIENTIYLDKQKRLEFPDQDALNYTFKEKVLYLNPEFNFQSNADLDMFDLTKNPLIIHYNGSQKPWRGNCSFYYGSYMKPLYKAGYKKEFYKINLKYALTKIIRFIFHARNQYKTGQKSRCITIFGITFKFKIKS